MELNKIENHLHIKGSNYQSQETTHRRKFLPAIFKMKDQYQKIKYQRTNNPIN
jgi:hypothetical protein